MKLLQLLPAVLLIAVLSGCSTTAPPPQVKMAFGVPDGNVTYKPVPSRNLSLRMVSKPITYAGTRTVLTFSISNNGNTAINIPEWLSHESDNLVVMVQPWLTGMKEPDENQWIELSFDLKKPVFHHPMVLMPGNQVLIAKELPFIEKIRKISAGMERRYFVKAKTNLKSLRLESDVVTLKVLPRKKTGEK